VDVQRTSGLHLTLHARRGSVENLSQCVAGVGGGVENDGGELRAGGQVGPRLARIGWSGPGGGFSLALAQLEEVILALFLLDRVASLRVAVLEQRV
jgi:hypothetical protein